MEPSEFGHEANRAASDAARGPAPDPVAAEVYAAGGVAGARAAAGALVDRFAAPRDSVRVGWEETSDPGPEPAENADPEVLDAYARRVALARFARRVLAPDPHAWIEALVTFWARVPLPVAVPYTVTVEDDLTVRAVLEMPPRSIVEPQPGETVTGARSRYADLCCRLVLTLAADAFRILPPAADTVYVTAGRMETNPATGHPHRAVLLRLATDRASLAAVELEIATPSSAFQHLGGAARFERGELVPLAFDPAPPAA